MSIYLSENWAYPASLLPSFSIQVDAGSSGTREPKAGQRLRRA